MTHRLDDKKPWWLWNAMIEHLRKQDCLVNESCECSESGECITEWCVVCAAKSWPSVWDHVTNGEQANER